MTAFWIVIAALLVLSSLLISAEKLQKRLGQPALTLIDARALPRFKGEVEPIDPIAGHIPGAQCAAFTDNLGSDGRFLPADQLKQRFPRHHIFHLAQKSLPLGAFFGSGLLVFTESELLAAHEP